eukprot:Skav215780  [mRNA]  locus=scaffold2278:174885:182497:+ [translate_table: standard]
MTVKSPRRKLLPVALLAGGFLVCNCFVPPLSLRRSHCHSPDVSADARTADCNSDGQQPASQAFSARMIAPVLASVVFLMWGMQPANALLPEEEQQGYIQNFLGYANLTINFLLGFFGMVFGPIIRQFQKPGPQKYFIAAGGLGIIVLLVWTVKEMIAI